MTGQFERRVEAISGAFNSQDVVNTLWAYATMGRKPGEAGAGDIRAFDSQEVANTLWSTCFFCWHLSVGHGDFFS